MSRMPDVSGGPGTKVAGPPAHNMSLLALCLGVAGLLVALGPGLVSMLGGGAGAAGFVCGVTAAKRNLDRGGVAISGFMLGAVAVLVAVFRTPI